MSTQRGVDNHGGGGSRDGKDREDMDRRMKVADIDTYRLFKFPVVGGYARNWIGRAALREFIQNWRDAIVKSNKGLNLTKLRVTRESVGDTEGEPTTATGDTQIVFKAFRDDADTKNIKNCLGFIRYKGRNGVGHVEIANMDAELELEHLYFGGTSKQGQGDQAGAHGEGLKLAAMVFMNSRHNHSVTGYSGGCKWKFGFLPDGSLFVRVNRMDLAQKRALLPEEKPYKIKIATPTLSPDKDVCFVIGEKGDGRDEDGNQTKRMPVQQKDFELWAEVALFLPTKGKDEVGGIIPCPPYGDLITAPGLRGNLFLKGLLLREQTPHQPASISGYPLSFGYNFANGKTDRERRSLMNAFEESKAICGIWGKALRVKPDLVGTLSELLNTTDPAYGDVACAKSLWSFATAYALKGYLASEEFAGRWYYCEQEMSKNPKLLQVIDGLGREAFKLTKKCWDILEYHNRVRTVEEEVMRRFIAAEMVQVPRTSFPMSMDRLLKACLRACPQTKAMTHAYVQAGPLQLNIAISKTEPILRIHERWLSMDTALTHLGLIGNVEEGELAADTAKRLFADVLEQLPPGSFLQEDSAMPSEENRKQETYRAERRLKKYQQMQVCVVDKSDDDRPGLCVEWPVDVGPQDNNARIEVQCHLASRCSSRRNDLLISSDADARKMDCLPQGIVSSPDIQAGQLRLTTCRVSQVSFQQGTHCESELKLGEEYFFVLATPADPDSFVRISNEKRVVAQLVVRPNPSAGASAQPAYHNDSVHSPALDLESEGESAILVRDSDSSEPIGRIRRRGRSHNAPRRSGAAPRASRQPGTTVPYGPFSPKCQLDKMKVLKFLADDDSTWFETEHSDAENNENYVVGRIKKDNSLPERSGKRRRVD